jgi:hypothetical protein
MLMGARARDSFARVGAVRGTRSFAAIAVAAVASCVSFEGLGDGTGHDHGADTTGGVLNPPAPLPDGGARVGEASLDRSGTDASKPDSNDSDASPNALNAPDDSGSTCTQTTCALAGAACGQIPDGCGAMLDCGGCAAGTCGGFGVANQCGGCEAGQTVFGPVTPLDVDSFSLGGAARSWTNPDNAMQPDGARATIASMTNFQVSEYLRAMTFAWSLPASANAVDGVWIEVQRATNLTNTAFVDGSVRLVKNGLPASDDRKQPVTWAPTDVAGTLQTRSAMYGGPQDKWGLNLQPGDISPAFGVAVSVQYNLASGSGTVGIDAMRMWICYR